jgi:hypothetical protein
VSKSILHCVIISENRKCGKRVDYMSEKGIKTIDLSTTATVRRLIWEWFYKNISRKFYGRYNDIIYPYNLSVVHMLSDMFHNNL